MKSVEFTYTFPKEVKGKFRRIYLPEVQLMSLVIVATKLLFPFDDIKRYPRAPNEPAVQVMDWDRWAEAQSTFDSRGISQGFLTNTAAMQATEKDAMEMTQQQLDEYMDWYDKLWLAGKGRGIFRDIVGYAVMLTLKHRDKSFEPFRRDVPDLKRRQCGSQ